MRGLRDRRDARGEVGRARVGVGEGWSDVLRDVDGRGFRKDGERRAALRRWVGSSAGEEQGISAGKKEEAKKWDLR